MKVRVVQHCFGRPGTGGPITALERLLAHSSNPYGNIRQVDPTGGFSLLLIRRFVSELRAYRPEIVHVRGLGNEGFHAAIAARIAGVPNILVSIHGTHRDLVDNSGSFRHWIVSNVLETLTLDMATHIATVCDFAAKRPFLTRHRHKFVGTVPNGVALPTPSTGTQADLRSRWGIPQDLPLGICVSRLTTEKGYFVLARALARLDDGALKFAVMVVGGGDREGRIRSAFAGLTTIKVVFTGHQNEVNDFLRVADFFILPSLHENLSNALIEAMGHGLPTIATDVGGNPEVVTKGGGVLVPVADDVALAEAIARFVTDSDARVRMSVEARENIGRNYSIQRMVAGWESIYSRILEDTHGRP